MEVEYLPQASNDAIAESRFLHWTRQQQKPEGNGAMMIVHNKNGVSLTGFRRASLVDDDNSNNKMTVPPNA